MAGVMHRMVMRRGTDRPVRYGLCAIRSCLCIAGSLRYATSCRLSLRRRGCRLLGGRVSASRSLVSLVRGVGCALFRGRLIRRTSREQRESQDGPGKTNYG